MSTELYGLVQSKITTDDIQAFKAQAKKMKDATENEIGTISYDFFINEEKREVFIVEKYADDKAFMAHMEQFLQEEFIPKILTMMELTSLKMLGPVTEEIDDFSPKEDGHMMPILSPCRNLYSGPVRATGLSRI